MFFRSVTLSLCAVILIGIAACGGGDQSSEQMPQMEAEVQTASTATLDEVVPAGVMLEKITGDYVFDTAGSPCWIDGVLYFTNNNFDPVAATKTLRMNADGTIELLRQPNGLVTSLHNSGHGTLYACEMLAHKVTELGLDGQPVGVAADVYNTISLDNPNDMVIDAKGGIYFTDSRFYPEDAAFNLDFPAVYYIRPDGTVDRVVDDIEFPNGLELTPDGTTLLVVDTRGARKGRYVRAYDVDPNSGMLVNGRDFCELELTPENEANSEGLSGADGTAMDSAGNLYVATTQGLGIQVINSGGQHIGNISCPATPNNIYFGGDDRMTMYVSALDGIYAMQVNIPGVPDPLQ